MGAPRWPPNPQPLGTAPAEPSRSSVTVCVTLGAPRWPPNPQPLGTAPARAVAVLGHGVRDAGGPRWPQALNVRPGPAEPRRTSGSRSLQRGAARVSSGLLVGARARHHAVDS